MKKLGFKLQFKRNRPIQIGVDQKHVMSQQIIFPVLCISQKSLDTLYYKSISSKKKLLVKI